MSYIINQTNGNVLVELIDSTLNQETSLTLVGKDYPLYGEYINENFVHLLENFCSTTAPTSRRVLKGQLWFDASVNQLKVYDGNGFKTTSGILLGASPPSNIGNGDLWLDTINKQLYVNDGDSNLLLGPIYKESQGINGFKVVTVYDLNSIQHNIVLMYVSNALLGLFSKTAFFPRPEDVYGDLTSIYQGFNPVVSNTLNAKYNGTALYAELLLSDTGEPISASGFVSVDGDSTVTGTLQITTPPTNDYDVVNLLTVRNEIKQSSFVVTLPASGMSNSDIITNYLDKLYPTSNYDTEVTCKAICDFGTTVTIKEFIVLNNSWQFVADL